MKNGELKITDASGATGVEKPLARPNFPLSIIHFQLVLTVETKLLPGSRPYRSATCKAGRFPCPNRLPGAFRAAAP